MAPQTSCGQGSCFCSCLLLDCDLTKAWFNTAREYLDLAKRPLKDVVFCQLLQPWKLATLSEHEKCFQQWNLLQLWIGIVATFTMLLMNFIWFLAEENDYAKPAMSSILLNAIVGLVLVLFFTHLAWFGVINKHGCCCFIVLCCEGKPNILAVAILSVVFGILGVISGFQLLGSAQGALVIVVLIGALFALIHGLALLYLGFEAAMIWKLSTSTPAADASEPKKAVGGENVIGAPRAVENAFANVEVGEAKAEA